MDDELGIAGGAAVFDFHLTSYFIALTSSLPHSSITFMTRPVRSLGENGLDLWGNKCPTRLISTHSMTFMTRPVRGLGKKYVDLWGMRSPAAATARTSLTFVGFNSSAAVAVPRATRSSASWSSLV